MGEESAQKQSNIRDWLNGEIPRRYWSVIDPSFHHPEQHNPNYRGGREGFYTTKETLEDFSDLEGYTDSD